MPREITEGFLPNSSIIQLCSFDTGILLRTCKKTVSHLPWDSDGPGKLRLPRKKCIQCAIVAVTCHGISMEPTLFDEDLVVIQKRNKYSIKRGDIVVVRNPRLPTQYICKRVVWLPGDYVHSNVYSGKIQKGFIWLQGDNIFNSTDSRHFGPVPKGLVIGKAEYIVWPLFKDLRT